MSLKSIHLILINDFDLKILLNIALLTLVLTIPTSIITYTKAQSLDYIGLQPGWVIDDSGNILVDDGAVERMAATGSKWVRINFRLGPYPSDTEEFYNSYDQVVDRLRARGFKILGLWGSESWPAANGQSDWTANNYEVTGGDGYNFYIDQFGYAFARAAKHFEGRIENWEIWNEPNNWTYINPDTGQPEGGFYIYPSNFAAMLAHVHSQVHYYNQINVNIISGGVFGHDINGFNSEDAGATYLDQVFDTGINKTGKFAWTKNTYGSYPLDGIGQHIYINQDSNVDIVWFNQYIDYVREVINKWEADENSQKIWLTEFGWQTSYVDEDVQADNLNQVFKIIGKRPDVEAGFWFQLDDNDAANLYWGLFRPDLSAKASFASFRDQFTLF